MQVFVYVRFVESEVSDGRTGRWGGIVTDSSNGHRLVRQARPRRVTSGGGLSVGGSGSSSSTIPIESSVASNLRNLGQASAA